MGDANVSKCEKKNHEKHANHCLSRHKATSNPPTFAYSIQVEFNHVKNWCGNVSFSCAFHRRLIASACRTLHRQNVIPLSNNRSLFRTNAKPLNAFILIDFHFNDGPSNLYRHKLTLISCACLQSVAYYTEKPKNFLAIIPNTLRSSSIRLSFIKVSVAMRENGKKIHFRWDREIERTKQKSQH